MPVLEKDEEGRGGVRIAKYLAGLGVDSRRGIEARIAKGEIHVNGALITTPAFFVGPQDQISVGETPVLLKKEAPRLFLYAKPCGLLVTHRDPQKRPTVFEALPKELPRLISVGRLDINSEGLLLLTNNGSLSRVLEHPQTGLKRTYRVRVWGDADAERLEALNRGIEVDGVSYGPIEARIDVKKKSNAWLTLSLWEGKNREIRRVLNHLDLSVNKLIRLSYGPFELGSLKSGQLKEVESSAFGVFLPTI